MLALLKTLWLKVKPALVWLGLLVTALGAVFFYRARAKDLQVRLTASEATRAKERSAADRAIAHLDHVRISERDSALVVGRVEAEQAEAEEDHVVHVAEVEKAKVDGTLADVVLKMMQDGSL